MEPYARLCLKRNTARPAQEEAEEEDSSNQQETVESDSDGVVRSRPGDRDWCACTNC